MGVHHLTAAITLDPSPQTVSSSSAPQPTDPTGVRVLVADDEPEVRRIVASALRRLGFEVRTVEDGDAAIALAEATPFDLALVDLGMPTGGFEVVRRLRSLFGQAIHIEILSGNDDPRARIEAFDAGVDGYLMKPISISELQKRVHAAARAQQAYVSARQAHEKADRLLAWGTEAAALLAHDLNNGLAIALSNMTYLSQVLKVDDDDERQALGATVRALRRMAGLVANFVDVARFEDDALRPRPGRVKVRELLLEVMAIHAPSMTRQIHHSVSCDQDIIANFDEALIARVLHNLVGNAQRYCNPGGTVRMAAREIVRGSEPTRIEIMVHNTGPHIPPALAARLFGKYAQGKDGQRGLGLYFCRLACEAHGGSVRHDATPDGPAFVLSLPCGQITPVG